MTSTVVCYSEHSQRCRGWNRAVNLRAGHLRRTIRQALALRIGNARNAGRRASKNFDSTVWMLWQTCRVIGLTMLLFLSTIIDASFLCTITCTRLSADILTLCRTESCCAGLTVETFCNPFCFFSSRFVVPVGFLNETAFFLALS